MNTLSLTRHKNMHTSQSTSSKNVWYNIKTPRLFTSNLVESDGITEHVRMLISSSWNIIALSSIKNIKSTASLEFVGDLYISDINIWNQFHFYLIFGYELKPIKAVLLKKDVKKWVNQLNRLLIKQQHIFLIIQLREKYLHIEGLAK